ncbi:MAG: hypothetical protein U9Q03_03450 [Patescibacteria group bacterium]|nr:hypothetical protein [Patescibacteria group bacterium]
MDIRDLFLVIARGDMPPERLVREIKQERERLAHTELALEKLKLLTASWLSQDPGKHGPYVFFVRDYALDDSEGGFPLVEWCDAFFARSFVNDLKHAEEGVGNHYAGPHQEPQPVPLGKYREVRNEPCERCKRLMPVIGVHHQSCDSPDGDVWELELLTLCYRCPRVKQIGYRSSEYRMTDRLKRPEDE